MDNRRMDDTKLLWHVNKIDDYYKHRKRVAPIHIDTGIAKFCNVKCVFCYGMYQEMQPTYIQRDALLNYISDAHEIGVKSIAFIGDGEPTCNPNMYEALDLAKSLGLDMAISTNGVLVDDEEKALKILKNCKWMRFCISAGTREGYKKIHQVDKFDKVISNIKMLMDVKKKYNLDCEIGMQSVFVPTIMIDEMLEESKLAIELGVDYFVIKQCSLPDSGESGMSFFNINDYDSQNVDKVLHQCENLSNEKTKIIPKWNVIKQKGARPYNGCKAVPFISEISGNGDWFPCGYMFGNKEQFKKVKFGNIQEQRLKDIFYSDHYLDVLEYMINNFDVHNDCKGACRLDKCNEFVYNYLNEPSGINFI